MIETFIFQFCEWIEFIVALLNDFRGLLLRHFFPPKWDSILDDLNSLPEHSFWTFFGFQQTEFFLQHRLHLAEDIRMPMQCQWQPPLEEGFLLLFSRDAGQTAAKKVEDWLNTWLAKCVSEKKHGPAVHPISSPILPPFQPEKASCAGHTSAVESSKRSYPIRLMF